MPDCKGCSAVPRVYGKLRHCLNYVAGLVGSAVCKIHKNLYRACMFVAGLSVDLQASLVRLDHDSFCQL